MKLMLKKNYRQSIKVFLDLFFSTAANWQNPVLFSLSNIDVFMIKQ